MLPNFIIENTDQIFFVKVKKIPLHFLNLIQFDFTDNVVTEVD